MMKHASKWVRARNPVIRNVARYHCIQEGKTTLALACDCWPGAVLVACVGPCVANVDFMLHYIVGDYSFTSDIILLVHVSNGRRIVMVTRGSM